MSNNDYEKFKSAAETANGALFDLEIAAYDLFHGAAAARDRYQAALDRLHRAQQTMEAL